MVKWLKLGKKLNSREEKTGFSLKRTARHLGTIESLCAKAKMDRGFINAKGVATNLSAKGAVI